MQEKSLAASQARNEISSHCGIDAFSDRFYHVSWVEICLLSNLRKLESQGGVRRVRGTVTTVGQG